MTKEYKSYDETTVNDALRIVGERFPPAAVEIAKNVINNPLRRLCADAGTIGYRDGVPVAFQAAMLRRLYIGREEILGMVGGLTCKVKKGCPCSVLMETIGRAEVPRAGALLTFGNSCCEATAMMDAERGGNVGPATCSYSRWRPVRMLPCLNYIIRRKIFKKEVPKWPKFSALYSADYHVRIGNVAIAREMVVNPSFFDVLMKSYLDSNKGLVCSRTAEEIHWMFGNRIERGLAVLLCARVSDRPVGYVIVGSDETARRWVVMDWFAVGNDEKYLAALLRSACAFLREKTPAFMLESRGFPSCIQSVLRRYLPFKFASGVNYFSWRTSNVDMLKRIGNIDLPGNWFFGPYDGDLVM